MPCNKDNHYVPRFLMRQFSSDPRKESERKWINLYLLRERRFVKGAGISGQCQQPYFYGKDPEIEKMFCDLECRTKNLLKDLSIGVINSLSEDELFNIMLFTYIQHLRTPEAAKRIDNFLGEMMKVNIEHESELLGIDLNRIKIHHSCPQLMGVMTALEALPFLDNLSIRFLRNLKGTEFVLSDHPAFSYNQFGEHHSWLGPRYSTATGIASKGVQLFMPLSPNLCVAVFDPSTYDCGPNLILDITPKDAWNINILQTSNANSCIYVKDDNPDLNSLKRLAVLHKKAELKKNEVHVWKGNIVDEPDGRKSQLSAVNVPDLRLGFKFSFAKIINDIDYNGYNLGAFPPRSFDQITMAKKFRNQLRLKSTEKIKYDLNN